MNDITRVDSVLLQKAWRYYLSDLEQPGSEGWRPKDFYVSRISGWFLLESLVARRLLAESQKIEVWQGTPCYRITQAGIDHLQHFEIRQHHFSSVNRAAYINAKYLRVALSAMHEPTLARLYKALAELPDLTHDQFLSLLSEQLLTPGQRRRRQGPMIHPSEAGDQIKKLPTLFALIFADTSVDQNVLSQLVHKLFDPKLTPDSAIESFYLPNGVHVQIHANEDRKTLGESSTEDFMNFPYCLEIDGAGVVQQISAATKILEGLWTQGIPAIAVCEYWNSLPESGGYFAGRYATHRWQQKS